MNPRIALRIPFLFSLVALGASLPTIAFADEAIRYRVEAADAQAHVLAVEARFPHPRGGVLELMMPVWSPGFYRIEDYAGRVSDLKARGTTDRELEVTQPVKNRWRITGDDADEIVVTYRLLANGRSVTTNWVDDKLMVLNPAAALMTNVAGMHRVHEVSLRLPSGWTAVSGLDSPAGRGSAFVARDYDTLVDSPIVAGPLSIHEFKVSGARHQLADAGDHAKWNGDAGSRRLARMVEGTRDYWGGLPFKRYVFLNVFRQGGGGLEHGNSTLLTSSPDMAAANLRWLSFVGHEYFHAFNVKRLRPVELGPFDYEKPPSTPSLWISEGLTTYGADLILARAGLCSREEYLGLLSANIASLQTSAGRLKQTLNDASLDVWTSGTSGVGRDKDTLLSYYVKGPVVGFLLDARIQAATNGKKSLQEVMRRAMKRFGGERGFTPEQFESVAENVAGTDLTDWFRRALASTDELDYSEALDWFGLRFGDPSNPKDAWTLSVRPDASPAQKRRLAAWLSPS